MPRSIETIKHELKAAVDRGLAACDRGDDVTSKALEDAAVALHEELRTAERDEAILSIGRESFEPSTGGLYLALKSAGFDRKTQPRVTVDQHHALGVRLKSGSFDGGEIEDAVPSRFAAPDLGLDARYIYPHVASQGVAADATGVQSYRQKSRALATPSDMIRAIDAVSTKPETYSTSEAVTAPLKQVASVSQGTPNVLLANQSFRTWVNNDLTGAYRAALDYHIVTKVGTAGIGTGGGGANIYEDILYSQEVVRAAGYSPNLVVVSPADALAIQLLQLTGGDSYVFSTPAPSLVVSASVDDGAGFVADSGALGVLFLGPFSLAVFEEDNGTSNSSTVRAESNGLYLVQRPDAAATISGS